MFEQVFPTGTEVSEILVSGTDSFQSNLRAAMGFPKITSLALFHTIGITFPVLAKVWDDFSPKKTIPFHLICLRIPEAKKLFQTDVSAKNSGVSLAKGYK